MAYVTPTPESVAELLEMVFGAAPEISDSSNGDFAGMHVATFVSDSDDLVALCACDRPFVCYSGAALSMIPPGVAKEAAGGAEFPAAMADNFYEIMNICSKLLMSDSSDHLRLDKVLEPDAAGAALSEIKERAQQTGFTVDVPRYGTGNIHFLVT